MSTTSDTSTTGIPPASEIAPQLKSNLAAADTDAAQAVQTLGLVHQARLSRASRTLATLTAKYGASDARVIAAQTSVTALQTTIAGIAAAAAQLTIPVVQVAAKGWALQGHVYDTNKAALAKYTIYLADEGGIFQKQYGFAYTGDTGYFLINYPGGEDDAAGKKIYVAILDTKSNPVYVSSTAFQPVVGAATLQDIYVPAGDSPLGDPSAAIRDVAFPATDAGKK